MPSNYQKGAETVDTSTQSCNTRGFFSKHYYIRVEVVYRTYKISTDIHRKLFGPLCKVSLENMTNLE